MSSLDRFRDRPEPNEARRLLFKLLEQALADAQGRGANVGRLELLSTALGRVYYRYRVDTSSIDIHPYYGHPHGDNTMRMKKEWFEWHEEDGCWVVLNQFKDDIGRAFVEVLTL